MQIQYSHLIILFLYMLICSTTLQDDDIIDISKINSFPQDYDHNIRAGYFNVSGYQQALYYIFCQSQSGSSQDPVILWLNGGPGCSSLIGFFTQNGPFMFDPNNYLKMNTNPYAWNKNAHILYLQSPGTIGFSTASTKYRIANDSSVAKDNLKALQLFFDKYGYRSNQFYIAGQSYAGIYIPRLAEQILIYNEAAQDSRINLKGILIGNGCTHPYQCYTSAYYSRFTTQFLYTRGFIDQNQYRQYKTTCLTSQSSKTCVDLQAVISQNFINSQANIYNVYAKCYKAVYPPKYSQIFRGQEQKLYPYHQTSQGLKHVLRCTDSIGSVTLLNTNEYRAALKVGQMNDTLLWTPCSDTLKYTMQSKATYSTLPTLVNAGLKIIYYSGDQDAIVPIQGSIYWFNKYRSDYKMPIKRSWRPWVADTKKQEISGMIWQLDGITLVTVRGAGHMVPSDKPIQGLQILNVFLGKTQWKLPDYYIQMTN